MKVIFEIFLKFLQHEGDFPGWKEGNFQNGGEKIGQAIPHGKQYLAEHTEINPTPCQQPGGDVHPNHAVPGDHGPDKQRGGGRRPEENVQHAAQPTPGDSHPQNAKQVIENPQRQPQHHRPGEGCRLS